MPFLSLFTDEEPLSQGQAIDAQMGNPDFACEVWTVTDFDVTSNPRKICTGQCVAASFLAQRVDNCIKNHHEQKNR